MEKITAETMRSYNRRQIFNHIYFNKRSSRQEIADTLHLSLTTVTQNLKLLEEENLIERSGYFQSTGGRKCVAYSCVSMYKISIGVHITAHHLRLVAVDMYGNILYEISIGVHITAHHLRLVAVDMYGNIFKRRRITENYCHSREYYQQFGAHIDTFIRSLNISPKRVLGVGIALTALLSKDRQHIAKSVLLGTTEAQLADFKEFLSYPCQLFHDSEAAADAELWFSPGITDALYLGLNHHLNGMLIMNRKIHAGKEYSGGLVEHITLYPGGRKCYCDFFQLLRSGSREESEKWQLFLEDLSVAIGSLSALLDCDIILGGTIGAYMIEDDRRRLQQLVRSDYHYAPSSDFICLGYKDVDICACGAAISYVDEFVKSL